MKSIPIKFLIILSGFLAFHSCTSFKESVRDPAAQLPDTYGIGTDTSTIAGVNWQDYFNDPYLNALIDTALHNNQELNIIMQEIEMGKFEVLARKGEILPSVNAGAGLGVEKEGRYTRHGAVDEQLQIREGHAFPDPLGDFEIGAYASWEVDIWRKLRNARDAATLRYLSSIEGKNFMVTNLVAEIAENYFELLALDNLMETINQNIDIQSNALKVVRLQKDAGKASQLAVNRFEAQLLKTQNLRFDIKQKIVIAENKINFLVARYPQPVLRSSASFLNMSTDEIRAGIPSQLLANRPDIKQAELELEANKLDVQVAKANFYPSLDIKAGVGFNAYSPKFVFNPYSILYNLAGELMAPIINRNGIKAEYYSANSKQLQAAYAYEQTILRAHLDVLNQLGQLDNFSKSFEVKSNEVDILNQSVNIAYNLFNSARADYVEVLLTQEESLEARLELIEVKAKLLRGKVSMYRALGGGWR